MKRIRTMGLCLVAAFAITAVAAATASATAPEYGRCLAHPGGKYATATCTTESGTTHADEWYPAFGKAANGEEKPLVKAGYKSKATESLPIQLEGTGEGLGGVKTKILCKKQQSTGTIISNKEATGENIVFSECESSGAKCNSPGAAIGEIKVGKLTSVLGVEKFGYNKEKHLVEPAKNKLAGEFTPTVGEEFVNFECGGLKVTVKGAVMFPIKTASMTLSATVKFSATGGNQKPEHFSLSIEPSTGKETFGSELTLMAKFEQLKLVPFEESGQTLTTTQTNEEKVEANPVA